MKRSAAYLASALGLLVGVVACSSDPEAGAQAADAGSSGTTPTVDGSTSGSSSGSSSGGNDSGATSDGAIAQDSGTTTDGGSDAGAFPVNLFTLGTWTFLPQGGPACSFTFTGTANVVPTPNTTDQFQINMDATYLGNPIAFQCTLGMNNVFTCANLSKSQAVGACNVTVELSDISGTLNPVLNSPSTKGSATITAKVRHVSAGGGACSALACTQATTNGTATIK